MDSKKGAPRGLVDLLIREAISSSPINSRSPSRDAPSDGLLSENQIELSSPELSSCEGGSLRPVSMYRISLRNKRVLSPLHTPSHTRLPSVLSPPTQVRTTQDTKLSVQQSSLRQICLVRSTTSPIRSCASGQAPSRWYKSGGNKRQTSEARKANNWATPPIWTTPGPRWKGNVWRYDLPRSYSHTSPSSSSVPPRSAYSVILRHQRAKRKVQRRGRKGKCKQRSQHSNPDEYADFKSVEHHTTTDHNNWYRQRDSVWSINDKSHGPNIVFPRRFDDPNFNRLNEWWWAGKKGADSHLGLGGWLNTDLLNAYIQSLKPEPELETAPRLGRNSNLSGSGVSHQDGRQSLCGICDSDGHRTRECKCCDACFAFGHVADQCPLENRHWMQVLSTFGLWNGDVELMAEGSSNGFSSYGSSSTGGSSSMSSSEGLSSPEGCLEEWEREWW
jgi:hypothetical protein